jgi:hypothetical protein
MNKISIPAILLTLVLTPVTSNSSGQPTLSRAELEKWFNSNDDAPPGDSKRINPKNINEGTLTFLHTKPKIDPHQARHTVHVNKNSLKDGWVSLEQCYSGLEVLPAAQILYTKRPIRNLKITKHENIDHVWIEGRSVQMTNLRPNARICTSISIQALKTLGKGRFELRTGPYRRKFLDGYFPIHLVLKIKHDPSLTILSYSPCDNKACNQLSLKGNTATYEALFEGKLTFRLVFQQKKS